MATLLYHPREQSAIAAAVGITMFDYKLTRKIWRKSHIIRNSSHSDGLLDSVQSLR